jgi:L-histidine N-alpha-methyltransferase
MSHDGRFTLEWLSEPADFRSQLARDVRAGLEARPRSLPSIYFYDDHGSELFEEITQIPEYYLTRAETEILETHAEDLISRFRPVEMMEIGAGFARKTRILLDAMHTEGTGDCYVPIDVSDLALKHAGDTLTHAYPWLKVRAYVGDFVSDLHRVPRYGRRIVTFLGSTIGNLPPDERPQFLSEVAESIEPDDAFILGVDLIKDEATMVAAYSDVQGLSAAFNKNILTVINRHLSGDFPLDGFAHETRFDVDSGCMEQSLRAIRDVTVRLDDIDLSMEFASGESIHTEWSCKFTKDGVAIQIEGAGLTVTDILTDSLDRFALVVATK